MMWDVVAIICGGYAVIVILAVVADITAYMIREALNGNPEARAFCVIGSLFLMILGFFIAMSNGALQ